MDIFKELDPIYTNAQRKLAAIKEAEQNQYITIFENLESPKPLIGIYSNLVLGAKGKCYYCETKTITNKDHFYPKSLGGILIVRCCIQCNRAKGKLLPSKWIAYANRSYSKEKAEKISTNTIKLIDQIINDGLTRPFKL